MKKRFILLLLPLAMFGADLNPKMQEYMSQLESKAKQENPSFSGFNYTRGEKIFTSTHIGKRGKPISCTSCHTTDLTQKGKNIHTGKILSPISPLVNPKSMAKVKNVKKWLKRNFKDVYNRVGTAQEKGDVIVYITTKK